jgi:hypothetical protein
VISHHAVSTRTASSRWALSQPLSHLDETTMMINHSLHKWVAMHSYVMTYVRLNLWWVACTQKIKFEYYLYILLRLKWKEWQVSCVRPSSRGKSICFVARPSCHGLFFAGFETFPYRGGAAEFYV